jgi:putative ABC transport system substrate-binding protein
MRTFQKDSVGQVCDRLLGMMVVALVISAMYPLLHVSADERARPIRIGALTPSRGPTPMIVGMRDGLLAFGYREDVDFFLGVRFTQGDIQALDAAAHELVQDGVDLLFVDSDASARAAQRATSQIPIVFATVADPLGMGLVQSFAHPGGNITGVTDMELHLGPKRLQVFKEIIPHLQRVLFPYDAANVYAVAMSNVYREAAQKLGITLVKRVLRTQEEARAVLAQIRKSDVDGILSPWSSSLNIPGFILEAATQQGIPTMFSSAFFLEEQGALASYAPDTFGTGKQAARLMDKILKGAKPADIPVEVNSKIEFVINLKTAKGLGLTIAPEVLYQADRLIR